MKVEWDSRLTRHRWENECNVERAIHDASVGGADTVLVGVHSYSVTSFNATTLSVITVLQKSCTEMHCFSQFLKYLL